MTFLDNLSPEDLLILTNAICVSLSEDKTADELNVLRIKEKGFVLT